MAWIVAHGVLDGFVMDPDTAVPLTAAEPEARILATLGDNGPYWVRVAHVDGWGIAYEPHEFKARLDNIGARLPTDGESVVIDANLKAFGGVDYVVAGAWTSHDALAASAWAAWTTARWPTHPGCPTGSSAS